MKHIILAVFILVSLNCLAAPSTEMSIVPIAVDSRTIKATDENARNNEVSTVYNAHDHTELESDSLTIGSGSAGAVDITTTVRVIVEISGTVAPEIKYDTETDDWRISDDGVTFVGLSKLQNIVTIGAGTAGNVDISTSVNIVADVSGTVSPTIRFNTTTGVWELSNDGNVFLTISTE